MQQSSSPLVQAIRDVRAQTDLSLIDAKRLVEEYVMVKRMNWSDAVAAIIAAQSGPSAAENAALRAELERVKAQRSTACADAAAIINAAAACLAVMTWSPATDPKWKQGDGIPDYATPEKTLTKLLKGPGRPGAALQAELVESRALRARVEDFARRLEDEGRPVLAQQLRGEVLGKDNS